MSETEITETVFTQYRTVQREGYCNMVDSGCVKNVAEQLGFEELVECIEQNDYTAILSNYDELEERYT